MGCFSCFGAQSSSSSSALNNNNNHNNHNNNNNQNKNQPRRRPNSNNGGGGGGGGGYRRDDHHARLQPDTQMVSPVRHVEEKHEDVNMSPLVEGQGESSNSSENKGARNFRLAELIAATDDFRKEYFLGEGGFGKVYKGLIRDTREVVAIKQLDRDGLQGIREFLIEVYTLCQGQHDNLVKLIGCCAEGDQRLLVYEFMPLGSLEDHLHGRHAKTLSWTTRMKIAAGAARGLEYLHTKMNPPIIYRDLKCSNILLGDGYHPKLSDFGLAKVGPTGEETHVSTRVMGTYGYCAPEYAMTGQLTFKSDIYSFGVVLLELITGRRAIDERRKHDERDLVQWARPLFKDRSKFKLMADPKLDGTYHIRSLYQALAIAAMCVQDTPQVRPQIGDIVTALNFLALQKHEMEKPSPVDSKRNQRSSSIGDEQPSSSKSC